MHEPARETDLIDRREGSFRCSTCGYGIARATPPDRCPMCHAKGTWVQTRRRSPGGRSELAAFSEHWLGGI